MLPVRPAEAWGGEVCDPDLLSEPLMRMAEALGMRMAAADSPLPGRGPQEPPAAKAAQQATAVSAAAGPAGAAVSSEEGELGVEESSQPFRSTSSTQG